MPAWTRSTVSARKGLDRRIVKASGKVFLGRLCRDANDAPDAGFGAPTPAAQTSVQGNAIAPTNLSEVRFALQVQVLVALTGHSYASTERD